ncbi:MAG: DUF4394 domain-containing protein [Planctomycetota bacterium]
MIRTSFVVLCLVGAVSAQDFYLATAADNLLTVRAGRPGEIARSVPLVGLAANEHLAGIDFRPATGDLFGLGDTSRVYRIDPSTGMVTAVAAPFSPLLNGSTFGFDFNPTVDRIRVVSDADQDLRLHPDTGAVVAIDGTLAYAPGDPFANVNPNVFASAYTNSFAGATSTTLYGIDSNLDTLVVQNPPNAGVLNTVGALGVNVAGVGGFDIDGTSGTAFAVLATPGSAASALFRIDLTSGAATFVAVVGTSEPIVGFSVLPTPGVAVYGVATPGCFGPSAIGALGSPTVGNPTFALTCDNAHPNTVGRLALATAPQSVPFPVLGFGLWVDPFSAGTVWLEVATDAMGRNVAPLPIPSMSSLRTLQLYDQYVWFDRCTRAGFAASNALALTVL